MIAAIGTSADALHAELRTLIANSRQRLAGAVNAELTRLYWNVGQRLRTEVLREGRASYGAQLLDQLGQQLSQEFGRGFEAKNLRRIVQFAQTIRVLHFNAVGRQHSHRKVLGIERHDRVRVANNGSGNNVAVVRIWQFDAVGQSFVIRYQTVGHAGVHAFDDQWQFGSKFWPVFGQIARPLRMNSGAPARVVQALNGQTQQGVADQLGIEDIGIQHGRVARRPRQLKLQSKIFRKLRQVLQGLFRLLLLRGLVAA